MMSLAAFRRVLAAGGRRCAASRVQHPGAITSFVRTAEISSYAYGLAN